ncbi:MAG: hypothetical protein SCH39_04975 [Methanosarcinales archaeon]|nr:hypothetical protein [Methanosarcinales archaeon]
MKQFSESNFDHIFIPLAIPILKNAGLIQMVNKNSNSPYTDTDNVNLNTICKLTDVTIAYEKHQERFTYQVQKSRPQRDIHEPQHHNQRTQR